MRTTTSTLQVAGMACTGCGQRIGSALRRVDGVREVTADHTTGEVADVIAPEEIPGTCPARRTAAPGRRPSLLLDAISSVGRGPAGIGRTRGRM